MGDVVNLKLMKKRRQRDEDAARAAENRALHGRTKAEKQRARTEAARDKIYLDGHRLTPHPPADE